MAELLDVGRGCKALDEGVVTSIRVLLPGGGRGDVLVVVKARRGDENYVGFVGGPDLVTALLTWKKKEIGEGLRFRREVPWDER